jgi:hypothetical protein
MQGTVRSNPRPRGRLGSVAVVVALTVAVTVAGACRFQAPGAYWIEAHGEGRAVRLAGYPAGVVAIGPDARLWAYPTDYARPWSHLGAADARAIAASSAALYIISPSNQVTRVVGGNERVYAGSVGWGPSAIAAGDDDSLFVVVGGHTRRVHGDDLTDAPCGDIVATSIAAASGGEIYVLDAAGGLYRGTASGCARVPAPAPLRDVAAFPGRVVVVGQDGGVWRRRGEEPWRALPAAVKYRPGRAGVSAPAVQAALSATCTWLLDMEGAVFVLSDET